MKSVTLSYSKLAKNSAGKAGSLVLSQANWKAICFACVSVCLMLLVFYVWQVRYLTSGFYSIQSYKAEVAKLSEEKKSLELGFAESGFLGQVQDKIRAMNFQKTTLVKYIQVPDSAVATAK